MQSGLMWTYPLGRYYDVWYDEVSSKEPTDRESKAQLVDRLRENPHTSEEDIRVEVEQGVAVLTGDVSSILAKRTAGDDAWDTRGVVDVSNQLRVMEGSAA